ncbi:hypothetical protein ABK040_005089 [Willaertia magna]
MLTSTATGEEGNSNENTEEILLYVCGKNEFGELGLNNTQKYDIPTKLPNLYYGKSLNNIYGSLHTLLFTKNKTLLACGKQVDGRLGVTNQQVKNNLKYFVELHFDKQIKIFPKGRSAHNIFLMEDGTLLVCGNNAYGQLGLGNKIDMTEYKVVDLEDELESGDEICKIVLGFGNSGLITKNGCLFICGNIGTTTFTKIVKYKDVNNNTFNLTDVTDIAFGFDHGICCNASGEVFVIGDNVSGQLGLPGTKNTKQFTKLNNLPFKGEICKLDCGLYHSFILTKTGELYTCGRNKNGQLGLGHKYNMDTFIQVLPTGSSPIFIKDVACGRYHTIIITEGNEIYGCGVNSNGQLGIRGGRDTIFFTKINILSPLDSLHINAIACGYDISFFYSKVDNQYLKKRREGNVAFLQAYDRDRLLLNGNTEEGEVYLFIPLFKTIAPNLYKVLFDQQYGMLKVNDSLTSEERKVVYHLLEYYMGNEFELLNDISQLIITLYFLDFTVGLLQWDYSKILKNEILHLLLQFIKVENVVDTLELIISYIDKLLYYKNNIPNLELDQQLHNMKEYCLNFIKLNEHYFSIQNEERLTKYLTLLWNRKVNNMEDVFDRPTLIKLDKKTILKSHLIPLFNNEQEGGDILIYLQPEKKPLKLHKTVLSSSSVVFEKMLNETSIFKDVENNSLNLYELFVKDENSKEEENMKSEAMVNILKFCYGYDIKLTMENIISIVHLSHELQMNSLFSKCCKDLESLINIENFMEFARWIDVLSQQQIDNQLKQIIDVVIQFGKTNVKSLQEHYKKELNETCPIIQQIFKKQKKTSEIH